MKPSVRGGTEEDITFNLTVELFCAKKCVGRSLILVRVAPVQTVDFYLR
jgi:hypothetical protein